MSDDSGRIFAELERQGRAIDRIDQRTARIENEVFFPDGSRPALITRVELLEQAAREDRGEKTIARVMTGVGTLIGSAIGAALAFITASHQK